MYAAFYGGMRNMRIKLIEGKDRLGGFLHTYAEKTIWDVGGVPPIRCSQFIEWLSRQAMTFEPTIVFNEQVERVERLQDGTFRLVTRQGGSHYSRTVIMATGRGMAELQRLEVEGAQRYELDNLHYTVQDIERFRGKQVLISGGGNSAVDWAIELAEVAAKVTVVHRRDQFRAMERSVERMREAAEVLTPYRIAKLHGSEGAIRQVALEHEEQGDCSLLSVDAVVVSHGYSSELSALSCFGLYSSEGMLNVDGQAATAVPGIFAAGDCAVYASKVRLIAGAFTDAALAMNSAKLHIEPSAPSMAYVSSHNERFRQMNRELAQEGSSAR